MVIIRKLQKKDYVQFANLVSEFRKISYNQDVPKKLLPLIKYKNHEKQIEADVNKYAIMNQKLATFFVAVENGVLIGYIWGNVNERRGRVLNRIGFIEDWFVKKEHRKKKIGIMLWNTMLTWFKRKKCNGLELEVFPNNYEAIKLYHKLGFVDRVTRMIKKID